MREMDKAEAERMKTLLCEAVSTLCRSGMRYTNAMRVEGLIAITVDEKDILVVNVNKTYSNTAEKTEDSEEEFESSNVNNKKKRHYEEDDDSFSAEDTPRPHLGESEPTAKRIRPQTHTATNKSNSYPRTPAECIKIEIDSDSDEDTKERLSLDDNSGMVDFNGSEQLHLEQVQTVSNVSGTEYDNSYNQPGPSNISYPEGALPIPGNQTDFSFAFTSPGSSQASVGQGNQIEDYPEFQFQNMPLHIGDNSITACKIRQKHIPHQAQCKCCQEIEYRREYNRWKCRKYKTKDKSIAPPVRSQPALRISPQHIHVCNCCVVLAKQYEQNKKLYKRKAAKKQKTVSTCSVQETNISE